TAFTRCIVSASVGGSMAASAGGRISDTTATLRPGHGAGTAGASGKRAGSRKKKPEENVPLHYKTPKAGTTTGDTLSLSLAQPGVYLVKRCDSRKQILRRLVSGRGILCARLKQYSWLCGQAPSTSRTEAVKRREENKLVRPRPPVGRSAQLFMLAGVLQGVLHVGIVQAAPQGGEVVLGVGEISL